MTERLEGENLALLAYETAPPAIGSVSWNGGANGVLFRIKILVILGVIGNRGQIKRQ